MIVMSGIKLDFKEPEQEEFRVKRCEDYPQGLNLVLSVCYHKVELRTPEDKSYLLNEPISLYLASSKGYIELSNLSTGESARIKARIGGFWHPFAYPPKVEIISEPLSLQEIQEIDELLGGESRLYWSIECLGFLVLEQKEISTLQSKLNYEISEWDLRGPVHVFFHGPTRVVLISRQDFVKKILEPAEMLRREFIEVIVEPINEKELNKLPVEFREALRILFEKQKVLLEALKKLRHATTTADYRGVIDDVRLAIEGLTPHTQAGQQVYQALKLAFKVIPLAIESDSGASGALDELSEEIVKTIMGQNNSFSSVLFKYSSKLGVHGKTESGKLYKPCPSKSEAEFAVLQAMLFLNYMIRIIKTAASRKY